MHGLEKDLSRVVSRGTLRGVFQFHLKILRISFFMYGLMRLSGIYQSLLATRPIGRSSGRTAKMLSCANSWARTMSHSPQLCFHVRFLEPERIGH
ncbi:hypothetical protein ACFX15_003600 [Malus domestica]